MDGDNADVVSEQVVTRKLISPMKVDVFSQFDVPECDGYPSEEDSSGHSFNLYDGRTGSYLEQFTVETVSSDKPSSSVTIAALHACTSGVEPVNS